MISRTQAVLHSMFFSLLNHRFMLKSLFAISLIVMGIGLLLPFSIGHVSNMEKPCKVFDWNTLPSNQWTQLSTCNQAPRKVFHGASAIAPEKRTVFFFGADTHEEDYDNSVYRLHLTDLSWSQDYEPDTLNNYRITPQGYAVTTKDRPWAMHTFDGWDYDPKNHTLVLVGAPRHATRAIRLVSPQTYAADSIKPATWQYDPDTRTWELIHTNTPRLFAKGFAWDPLRDHFIGHDGQLTYHYDPRHQEWIAYPESSTPGYHFRLVYDTFANSFLSLGNNHQSNVLWSYSPRSVRWQKISVAQPPLPANGAAIAYDTHHQVLLYVANDFPTPYKNPSGKSATFLYQSQKKEWTRLLVKSPPLYGMNYLMQYDQKSGVFLHFEQADTSSEHMAVWAFRYDPVVLKNAR